MQDRPVRVLVVEDERLFAEVMQGNLALVSTSQFVFFQVSDLAGALKRLAESDFDVVLLDLWLPDSQGFDTFARLHAAAPALPIVILTGVDDESLALKALRAGAQDYLVKGQVDAMRLSRVILYAMERKQVEQSVRGSEEFFRMIWENLTDLIAVISPAGVRLYNSPSYKNVLGEPSDLLGTDSFQEIHPEDREMVKRIFRQMLETGSGQRAEYRFLLPDGSVRYVESLGNLVRDEAGQPGKVVVVSRDITRRRQMEERLRSSEALYHSLVESLPQHILRKDAHGRFTFGNQRFCASLRLAPEEILGRTDFDFYPRELAEKYQEDDRQVMGTGRILDTVEEHLPPGGQRMVVHVVKTPVHDAKGEVIGIQAIFWDITEQKHAEEQIKQANAALARRSEELKAALTELSESHEELKSAQLQLIQAAKLESVGTLAAGVAHEVKNPLQTILMGLSYLTRNVPLTDPNLPGVLSDMQQAVKRADGIVRGLLDIGTVEQIDTEEQDLNRVISQSLMLVKYQLTRAKIDLKAALDEQIPRLKLDRPKMEQVFVNLFMNAIQAMQDGGILWVSTRLILPAEAEHVLQFPAGPFRGNTPLIVAEVRDTGPGIATEHLTRVFDPFFTTKPTGLGTGLGLSVTKKIIELHGGLVEIRNDARGGARVTLVLQAPLLTEP